MPKINTQVNSNFLITAIMEINQNKIDESLINNLFLAGLDLLYLRCNNAGIFNWEHLINEIDPKFINKIIIPSSARMYLQNRNIILHYKELERGNFQPDNRVPGHFYSTSVHQLLDIINLSPAFRYVFYSPLFKSISKPGYSPQYSLKTINQFLKTLKDQKKELPVIIGLGGIKAENIKLVKELGFDGSALMGALWLSENPLETFLKIKLSLEN